MSQVILTNLQFRPTSSKISQQLPADLQFVSAFLTINKIENRVLHDFEYDVKSFISMVTQGDIQFVVIRYDHSKAEILHFLIDSLKKGEATKEVNIILYGDNLDAKKEHYIKLGVDIVVLREAEQTVAHLITTMNIPMNPFLSNVNNIAFKNALDDIVVTPSAEALFPLEKYPIFDIASYGYDEDSEIEDFPILIERLEDKLPEEKVVRIIKNTFDNYKVNHFTLVGKTVLDKGRYLKNIADQLVEMDLHVSLGVDTLDRILTEKEIKHLVNAGAFTEVSAQGLSSNLRNQIWDANIAFKLKITVGENIEGLLKDISLLEPDTICLKWGN